MAGAAETPDHEDVTLVHTKIERADNSKLTLWHSLWVNFFSHVFLLLTDHTPFHDQGNAGSDIPLG